ncbi:30S ribosomal protein S12 methylthiotransferase RimO [Fodinicola feengrottensis]|uniref:Ribosomal protein uS12 methylthiotransferase RimO n=1 Tax=Fodinicola feengrottensis TaxID=435914 RepID=A0ABN2H3D7_9ACTN
MVTLGCARNEVDSEELAGRLAAGGWELSEDTEGADVVLVNTCGFIEQAKKDSVDTILQATDSGAKVVATGCMAERYGKELAEAMPEADAVLGFDHYPDISDRLLAVLSGEKLPSHVPSDRRKLLPISPVDRAAATAFVPGHTQDLPAGVAPASGPRVLRKRLEGGPVAPLKIASGCDRRCAFCAIPSFRGAFTSRRPAELLTEARWLAEQGVRELVLVSENSTSYGKDLGDPALLAKLLPELAAIEGIVRVRASYLQPAELRPELVEVICNTPGVAAYLDLSFQHASEPLLRRMRRFGSRERFLELLATARAMAPELGARTNVIVGFPGETRDDVRELERFLNEARLDAVGVFAYSDEEGTEGANLRPKVKPDTITRRQDKLSRLVEELSAQRAEERIGTHVDVLVESIDEGAASGRGEHQAPEVDGEVAVDLAGHQVQVGDLVRAKVTGSLGVDLTAELVEVISPAERVAR